MEKRYWPELEQLSLDNFRWMRMRWVSLLSHGLVLAMIGVCVAFYDKMTKTLALLLGGLIGILLTRLAVRWSYEARLKRVFLSGESAGTDQQNNSGSPTKQ